MVIASQMTVTASRGDRHRKNTMTKLNKEQQDALVTVATRPRTNLTDIGGETYSELFALGLLEKDWHKNDASGERVILTDTGRDTVKELL
jgi:hypothetical protein